MKIIILNAWRGRTVTLNLNNGVLASLALVALGSMVSVGAAFGTFQLRDDPRTAKLASAIEALERDVEEQEAILARRQTDTGAQLAAYAAGLAEMKARLVRLDALGERITQMAGLDEGEFDFTKPPALGGPEESEVEVVIHSDVDQFFREVDAQLVDRERQLELLKIMMADRRFKHLSTPTGLPVAKGWISSGYGLRRDPFHGKKSWHKGIDIAGKEGSPVIAVAGGLVTRSETRPGYGELIEIDHGDAMIARYAHNKENLVKVGDLVKKGQVIARMGSTGRATGSHVHFELHKNGRHIDPASYIRRTIR